MAERLRRSIAGRSWIELVAAVSLVGGAALWGHELSAGSAPLLSRVAAVGLCAAWAMSLTATVALVGGALQYFKRRGGPLVETSIAATLMMVTGLGLLLALTPSLAADFDRQRLSVVLTGGMLATFGAWRRRRPYANLLFPVVHLVLTVFAFVAPREAGYFELRWADVAVEQRFIWRSEGRCADRATPPALGAGDLPGVIGQLVGEGIGGSGSSGGARAFVAGRLPEVGAGCHLPFARRLRLVGRLTVSGGGSGCRRELLLDLRGHLLGVGSCRDLLRAAAERIVVELRQGARRGGR